MDLNLTDPAQIKQLIAALQSLLPSNIEEKATETEPQSKIKTKTARSGNKNFRNKFLEMPEKDMYKSDTKIDKKLSIHPPSPRNRKFSTIDVVCRSCGKKESVNPQIVPDSVDRYKCNKCSSSASN